MMRISRLVAGIAIGSCLTFAAHAEVTQPWWHATGVQVPPGSAAEPGRAEFEAFAAIPRTTDGKADYAKTAALLEQSAQKGFAPAQAMLAVFQMWGMFNLPKDMNAARDWADRSAKQGNRDGIGLYALLNFKIEADRLSAGLNANDPAAKQAVNALVRHALARTWKSLDGGSIDGEFAFATIYGVVGPLYKAPEADWLSYAFALLAEERGMSDGDLINGLGKPLSRAKIAEAEVFVGEAFDRHLFGLQQNPAVTAKWWQKSAALGNAEAQYGLGNLYRNGSGVPRDDRLAMMWFRRAAAQGSGEAENNIGVMYENGEGVTANYTEALTWFRKSARHGIPLAASNMQTLQRVLSARRAATGGNAGSNVGAVSPQIDGANRELEAVFAADMWKSGEPGGDSDD